jgi:accessory gene regulator B
MIGKLAYKTAKKFIKHPNICYDKIEIYQYGFFVLFSNILFLFLTIILGAVLNVLLSSIVFYIAFFSIRQYAGGYHASTETRCEIFSTLSILACIVVIRLSKIYDFQAVLLILSAVSAVCIFALCPLDTPEKPLSEKEFRYFRKISWVILSAISFVAIVSYFTKLKWLQIFFTPCCLSLVLESFLLVAGKLKKVSVEKKL